MHEFYEVKSSGHMLYIKNFENFHLSNDTSMYSFVATQQFVVQIESLLIKFYA